MGNPEGKRPVGRPRRMQEYKIKMDLRLDGVVWNGLIWLKTGSNGGLL
jgi:hypothetical protein